MIRGVVSLCYGSFLRVAMFVKDVGFATAPAPILPLAPFLLRSTEGAPFSSLHVLLDGV